MTLQEFLAKHDLVTDDTDFICDGDWHPVYFSRGKASYLGVITTNSARRLVFHIWKTQETYTYFSEGVSESDISDFRVHTLARKLEVDQMYETGASRAQDLLSNSDPAPSTPYARRKGINTTGLYMHQSLPHALIVPLRDRAGKVWSTQAIKPSGEKSFQEEGRTSGCFFLDHGSADAPIVLVSEGVATAKSVTGLALKHGLSDFVSVAAMTAYNLHKVAALFPSQRVIVCADNDYITQLEQGFNPGLEQAELSSDSILLAPPAPDCTDWNDYYLLEPVHCQKLFSERLTALMEGKKVDVRADNRESGITGVAVKTPISEKREKALKEKGERQTKPTHKDISLAILSNFPQIVAFERRLFCWSETHWLPIHTKDGCKFTKESIQPMIIGSGITKAREIDEVTNMLIKVSPPIYTNPYLLCNTKYNFTDGTLHLDRDSYSLSMKPHNKNDSLMDPPSVPWDTTNLPRNGLFLQFIDDLVSYSADPKEAKQILKEMFGTTLMPAFPKLFLLWGKSNSGKTTLLKVLLRLLGKKASSIDPSEWSKSFGTYGMAGKLYNCVLDLKINTIFPEDILKKMLDGEPINVSRKFQDDISATLPCMHYCATNDLPKSLDATGALEKRIRIVKCDRVISFTDETLDYDKTIWEQDMGSILDFAKDGLNDILKQKGKLSRSRESTELARNWENSRSVGANLKIAIEASEIPSLIVDPKGKISRNRFWALAEPEIVALSGRYANKLTAFESIRTVFPEKKTMGSIYFFGVREASKEEQNNRIKEASNLIENDEC